MKMNLTLALGSLVTVATAFPELSMLQRVLGAAVVWCALRLESGPLES